MKILAINCGSSTLKFQLIEVQAEHSVSWQEQRLASGFIDGIGDHARIQFAPENAERFKENVAIADHGEATNQVLSWLSSTGLVGFEAVGHRVVHGGVNFMGPTLIDDDVIKSLEALSYLAPLHNEPSLRAIRVARSALGSALPQVATFDTSFHLTIPEKASKYAIPWELTEKHGIRRYGFHGLAHRYMTERYVAITGRPTEQVNLITLQLGNGCSATAVRGGCSIDTSMGLTPLEGLIMGTRSGDVDPSLAGFLARNERVSIEQAEAWLNTQSGLLGISGRSRDMRELLEAEAGRDARAALAVEMFCYRVRKYIGAYLAVLGQTEAIIFGGGIGENAPSVRARICDGMEWCGLVLDPSLNARTIGSEGRISAGSATLHAYVIPVDEEVIIARDTVGCLASGKGTMPTPDPESRGTN